MKNRNLSLLRSSTLVLGLHALTATTSAQTRRAEVIPIAPACGATSNLDLDQTGPTPALRLTAPSQAFAIVLLGSSDVSYMGIPLPFRLDPLGLPACSLYASGDILATPLLVGASGQGALPLPSVVGDPPIPVFAQAIVLAPDMSALAGASNAIAIDHAWTTEYTDLPQHVIDDFEAGRIPWRNLTAADIDEFARQAHTPVESPQALTDWMRTYVAMDDAQLSAALRGVQREGFAAAGLHYVPEAGMSVAQIAAATDWAIAESRRRLGVPLHLAAIRGLRGVEDIMTRAFVGTQPPINGCGDVSFPTLYGISYRLPRFGWSSSTNLRRQGSLDGCFNYQHNFSHDIRNITPTSPAVLGMVGAHGLGWRLYGNTRSLYYRGWWATTFGVTFVTMQAGMQIRKV